MKKLSTLLVILTVLFSTATVFAQLSFTPKTDFTTGGLPQSLSVGDMNGDGKKDLAMANFGPSTVSVLLNTTAPGSSVPSFALKTDFSTGSFPNSVSIGDVNGDGRPDLAVANSGSNTVSVLLNTTALGASLPTLSVKTDFPSGSSPSSVSLGDVNGDGKPDLAVVTSIAVSVLLNTTALGASLPTFTAKTDFPAGTSPNYVSTADINGDGRPDLVVVLGLNAVSIYLNTTAQGSLTPTFSARTDFPSGTTPHGVSIVDLNGDGKPDLAVANTNSNSVSVLLNTTGLGASVPTFTAKTDLSTGGGSVSVSTGDVNGDGKPDLAVANPNSNTVSVLLNTTATASLTPSFTAKTDFITGNSPFSVSLAELNGDAKTDLAVVNSGSNTVSVLLNTSTAGQADACITWDLSSTTSVTSTVGNINGQPESIGAGTTPPLMSVFLPYSSGQRLWVGNTGWVAGPLDPARYVEFNASPQTGNNFTVTNVSFTYGDNPLTTNFNILNFKAYYSTDNWATSTVLNSTALVYLNTSTSMFTMAVNVVVPNGQTFSLRIYPYALQNGIAMTPTFAIHSNVAICGTTAPVTSIACITPPDSMVGWWTGDNNANDISGNNNHGTLQGGAAYGSGKVANAFTVVNAADYVSVPDHPSLNFGTGNFSIDAWARTTDSSSVLNIVDKRTGTSSNPVGYSLFISSGKLAFQMGDGQATLNHSSANPSISDGKWHFVAVTVDRKNTTGGKLFVDGNQIFTFDPTTRPGSVVNTAPLFIGQRHISSPTQFKGQIDEVEMFNSVLSANEILSIFSADSVGKCKPAPSLGSICGVKFNDLNGNGVKDAGEPGLPDWQISLNVATIPPVKTDNAGTYCFNNLPAGTYTITETNQTGWKQTAPASPGSYTVTLAGGQNISGQNFGNQLDPCKNGTKAWSPLGTGVNNGTNGEVWAFAIMGSDLYVGGAFTTAGGTVVNHVAKWNGSAWSALIGGNGAIGVNGAVFALEVHGTDLYAGGWFTSAGGSPAMNIAKWDGSSWSALGSGLPGSAAVEALAVMGDHLYAGGGFTTALGGPGDLIAKWSFTNSNWSAVGTNGGTNDRVNSLAVIGTDLYAGGQFTTAGGVNTNFIAKWNGSTWSSLGTGINNGMNLRVGGGLGLMGGNLYPGGVFTTAGTVAAVRIAKWDVTNSVWSALGTGMNDEVQGFAVIGSDLYASGGFTTAGGVNANRVAQWNGVTWSPLGTGMNDGVWRLAAIGTDLYAGGVFTTAGGVSANYVAKYSCSSTTSVDDGRTGSTLMQRFQLEQNYPNPFNPSTKIEYTLESAAQVSLKVYNLLGNEVATLVNARQEAGSYTVPFTTNKGTFNLPSGVYFYRLEAGSFVSMKKLVLMK